MPLPPELLKMPAEVPTIAMVTRASVLSKTLAERRAATSEAPHRPADRRRRPRPAYHHRRLCRRHRAPATGTRPAPTVAASCLFKVRRCRRR